MSINLWEPYKFGSAYGKGSGIIEKGIITGYDKDTKTATISPYDGRGTIEDVVVPMSRNDELNKAYSMMGASMASPCLFTEIGGEAFLIHMFPAVNLSDQGIDDYVDVINTAKNRTPSGMKNDIQPGTISMTNSKGSEVKFSEDEARVTMVPGKLSAIFNIINHAIEVICTKLSFRSGAMILTSLMDTGNAGNVTVDIHRSMGCDPPTLNITLGDEADVFNVNINDDFLIHIDGERNVTIETRNVNIKTNDVKIVDDNVDITTLDVNTLGKNLTSKYATIDVEAPTTTIHGNDKLVLDFPSITLKGNVTIVNSAGATTGKFNGGSIDISGDNINITGGNVDVSGSVNLSGVSSCNLHD